MSHSRIAANALMPWLPLSHKAARAPEAVYGETAARVLCRRATGTGLDASPAQWILTEAFGRRVGGHGLRHAHGPGASRA